MSRYIKVGDRVKVSRFHDTAWGRITRIERNGRGRKNAYAIKCEDGLLLKVGREDFWSERELEPEDDAVQISETPQTIEQHLQFLSETLIPDLRESGSDATADDFARCVGIVRDLQSAKTIRTLALWLEYCGATSAAAFESAIASFYQRGTAAVEVELQKWGGYAEMIEEMSREKEVANDR